MQLTLSWADWIAIAPVVLSIVAKVFSDWSINAKQTHNLALARITGMAGRQAATIARSLESLPSGLDREAEEHALITASAKSMLSELSDSNIITGADSNKLSSILQGELDKIIVAKKPVAVTVAAPP